MCWDYNKMCLSTGDYWNKRPLDEQMEILQKYYPIGMKLKYYTTMVTGEDDDTHGES